ncbi:MAG: hypothetical protein ACREFL_20435 [Stellaceae bacterium]
MNVNEATQAEPIFTVRSLKFGTFAVVMQPDERSPTRHISDFRSAAEAQTWIREQGSSWVKRNL